MRCLHTLFRGLGLAALCALLSLAQAASTTYNGAGSSTWKAPTGVTSITVEAWGAGGAGGGATANPAQGGGGAGGQYVRKTVTVVPGTNYTVIVGAGGNGGTGNGPAGGDSTFASTTVVAKGGAGGTNVANGVAGLGSTTGGVGDVVYAGGNGSNGDTANKYGAGGGGAGSTGTGGSAVGRTGGVGTTSGGGDGANGRDKKKDGSSGNPAGGGGSGGYTDSSSDTKGGDGGDGMVTISYANLPTAATNAATAIGPNDATLNGSISSNDGVTTVTFEYGLTTGYGTTVTASQSPLAFDAASTAVSATISGLTQSTTYHFRVKATNSAGTTYGLDRTFTTSGPPVVLSINRASFDPTSANTVVSWTVVFDRGMTGVDTADFSLIQGGGATGASITSVTGSGTTWTVTANTGTGTAGTVRLDLIDNDTIVSVSGSVKLGGTGLGNGSYSGQTYTIVTVCTNAAPQIFCDDFERANPGAVGTAPNYGAWTVTPASTSSSCSGGAGNTGCAGIDSDIPPFNTYAKPRANSTRSMFTRWSALTVDSPTINLAGRPAALLSFWMRRGSDGFSECPEAVGENYLVQFWDGTAWQVLAQYPSSPSAALCGAGEVWTPVIQLPSAALHAGFKLRFAQPSGSGKSGSGGAPGVVGYDYWHLDNVIITEAPASSYSGPFCDNFEGGLGRWSITAEGAPAGSGTTAGLEIGDARLGTSNFNSAGNALDMRWGYVVASTLRTNMTGVTGSINYWLKSGTSTRDPASGENLLVEYFNDAGTWTTLATYQGSVAAGTVYNGSHTIPANAKHAGFRLRFRMLAGSGYDLSYWHLDDVCVGTVVPTADLAITKTRAGSLVPGTNVPYNITVTNNGPGAVAGTLQVVDTLPAGLSFYVTGSYGTGWSCSASGQVVTCNYLPGALASGASAPTLTITAAVTLSATGTIVNTATVFGSVIDNVSANNTATDTGTVLGATMVVQYRMEDASWGVLTDSAGYVGGPFNGSSTGSPVPSPAFANPARGTVPGSGTCGYASLPGPASGGGALTTASNLPLLTSPGVKTSVAFWMYWDGTTNVMPIGWNQHGLMLSTSGTGGAFGFTTTGGDIYGAASSTLATGWHHVAAVFTNGSVVDNLLYVDGVLQTLTQRIGTPTLANAVVSTTLTIGGWGSTTGLRFSGRLDEVKVYKDVLVQSDVTAIYAEMHTCVAAVDHYELSLPTEGIACLASTATVTACSNSSSPCSSPSTLVSGQSASLAVAGGGSLGTTSVTFNASGVASTTLSFPTATDGADTVVTLSGEPVTAVSPRKCCPDGVNCVARDSCTTKFRTAGFIFSSSVGGSEATVPTQVAGIPSSSYYLRAVKTLDNSGHTCGAAFSSLSTPVNFAYECNDPVSCAAGNLLTVNSTPIQSNNNDPLLGYSYTSINLAFDGNGNSTTPLNLSYEDVGQVSLRVQKTVSSANLVGKTNAFIVKPDHFAVDVCNFATAGNCVLGTVATPTNGTGSILAISGTNAATQAGTAFKATVRSMSANNNVTLSFGTAGSVSGSNANEAVALTHNCVAPIISPATSCAGGTGTASLAGTKLSKRNTFTGGVKTVSDLTWDDVGVITLAANKTADLFMGAASAATGTSANAGRFRPDHFNTVVAQVSGVPMACPDGLCPATYNGIVYSGQPFSVMVTAKNANDATTANYSAPSGFAKTTTLTPYGALGTATAPSGAGNLGVASVTAFAAGTLTESTEKYTFTTAPTTPTNIYINASDGEASSRRTTNPTTTSIEGGVRVVSGRINIPNMYGSERLQLPLTATVQYYNSGTNWVTSLTDSVTSFNTNLSTAGGNLVATVKTGLASGITVVTPGTAAVVAGVRTFILAAPLVSGSVELSLNAPTYLPNAASRATFGIFKSPLIYRRENY
jgi:hypothetical protein